MWAAKLYINKASASFADQPPYTWQEPDYKVLIPSANLRRRMSRFVKLGVATAMQCLADSAQPDAILTATSMGCLVDTERFLKGIFEEAEQIQSPTLFSQSTFNTIGSQIALLTGNRAYNNTYVHRAFSLETALIDASMLIAESKAHHILLGVVEEKHKWLSEGLSRIASHNDYAAGEGAAFFSVSAASQSEGNLCILDLKLQNTSLLRANLDYLLDQLLAKHKIEATDCSIIYPEQYKAYAGEYPTAMGFGLYYALQEAKLGRLRKKIVLCNQIGNEISLILLSH